MPDMYQGGDHACCVHHQLMWVPPLLFPLSDSRWSYELHVKWKEETQVPLPAAGKGKSRVMEDPAIKPSPLLYLHLQTTCKLLAVK